jgi:hypothetical protein
LHGLSLSALPIRFLHVEATHPNFAISLHSADTPQLPHLSKRHQSINRSKLIIPDPDALCPALNKQTVLLAAITTVTSKRPAHPLQEGEGIAKADFHVSESSRVTKTAALLTSEYTRRCGLRRKKVEEKPERSYF